MVRGDLSGATAPAWAYALPLAGIAALLAASFLERRAHAPLAPADALPLHCATSALPFSAVAVGWVVLLSTLGGYGCYWLSLRRDGITRTSALIYLTPPTTALWTYAMWRARPAALGLVGMAVCVASVAAATLGDRPRPAPTGAAAGPPAEAGQPKGADAAPVTSPGRPTATARRATGR